MSNCDKSNLPAFIGANIGAKFAWCLLSSCLLLAGCASEAPKAQQEQSLRPSSMTMVSSFRSKIRVPAGASFTWLPKNGSAAQQGRESSTIMQNLIETAIINTLQKMGYHYTESVQQSAFLVGYRMAMGDEEQEQALGKQYGVQPGLSGAAGAYKKGTLVIDIVHAQSETPIWNGAIQAFQTFDLSQEQREQRINNAVFLLLRGFKSGS